MLMYVKSYHIRKMKKCLMIANQERMHLPWILSHKDDINFVLSWTGVNILIKNKIPIFHSNILVIQAACAPATEMNTFVTMLDRCMKMKEHLQLKCIVCVFDQAINCKAIELKWRYPDRYNDCLIMLESFIWLWCI